MNKRWASLLGVVLAMSGSYVPLETLACAAPVHASNRFTEQALAVALGRFLKPYHPTTTIQQNHVLVPLMRENTIAAHAFKATFFKLQNERKWLPLSAKQELEDELWKILKKEVPEEENIMQPVAELLVEQVKPFFGVEKQDEFIALVKKQVLAKPDISRELDKIKENVIRQHKRVLNTRLVYPAMREKITIKLTDIFRPADRLDKIFMTDEFDSLVKRLLKGFYVHRSDPPHLLVPHALNYVRPLHGRYDAWALKSGGVPLMMEYRPRQRRLVQAA